MLLSLVGGGTQFYAIDFCVDIKGNITILSGAPLGMNVHGDIFGVGITEDYLHLYDGWQRGADLVRMEHEAAAKVTRAQLLAAYRDFRQQHPCDGYGLHAIAQKWQHLPDDGLRAERDDIEDVKRELRRRNRQYIAELYGERLPEDFDFRADYDKRQRERFGR